MASLASLWRRGTVAVVGRMGRKPDTDFSKLPEEAVVIDCETTGVRPKRARIVSIAMAQLDSDEEPTCYIVNPGIPIPASATRVHGLSDSDVTDKPPFSEIASSVRDYIARSPVIAHHVRFDVQFLDAEFQRADVGNLDKNSRFCTLSRARKDGKTRFSDFDLNTVARTLGVGEQSKIHDASEDVTLCRAIARIFRNDDLGDS